MAVSLTYLRSHLYQLVDQVLTTGKPITVVRKGKKVRIVSEEKRDLFSITPPKNKITVGDPGDLAKIDWSKEWKAGKGL